ncbi:MAG TPA: RNA polymerase subunit sigma-70 [Acidimicrobiales bacterium]|nr:RNA polymerase subunit sigma-70 [Acidimicrobiales bacterium]
MVELTSARCSAPAIAGAPEDLERLLEDHRVELTSHCRRVLGSASEAEDAVQETLVRAWRGFHRFEGRAGVRSWLYRIATNVCVDHLRARRRRPDPVDLHSSTAADRALEPAEPGPTWALPSTGSMSPCDAGDPGEVAISREAVRLAFVAALRLLPPRQRAVLILCEVLRWRAAEVADVLDTSVASVNSALQRARSTLAGTGPHRAAGRVAAAVSGSRPDEPMDEAERRLLARYVDAFERYDVDSLVALLR